MFQRNIGFERQKKLLHNNDNRKKGTICFKIFT